MKNFPGLALLVMLTALLCQASVVHAGVVPDDPAYTNITSDPNIASTCNNDVVYEQYNALGNFKDRYEKELADSTRDKDILTRAARWNESVRNVWFCPIKITMMTGLVSAFSTIAAGIASALIAALSALVTTLITDIINSVCQAFVGAINAAIGSLFCIPPINLNIRMPNFSFAGSPGATCAGTALVTITGGPPLTTPPLNYGASLPGTNWQGSVNVIK